MFEKEFDIASLIIARQKAELSNADMQKLDKWLAEDPANRAAFEEWGEQNALQLKLSKFNAIDEQAGWNKVKAGIDGKVIKKSIPLWPRILVAAAAIAFMIAGVYFYRSQTKPAPESYYVNDVKPGTVGATLTLSNGKKIRLSGTANGKLAEESGIVVKKTADGQLVYEATGSPADPNKINTLTTAKGETYVLTLPDKSKVWLNAASSLTYVASLRERGRRVVRLSGEGYFEVSRDKDHPFVVESKGQQVEVLGTHFNINSYPDEPVARTTLIEGSVKVSAGGSSAALLKPEQQASIQNGKVMVADVNPDLYVAWKNNNFVFEKNDIRYIMRQLERWYNVEVIYESVPTEKFWGSVSKFDNISSVLNILESAGGVRFKLQGQKLYVNKN